MELRPLILEASHSYMVYMSLVPNARLLKWADVLLQIEPIITLEGPAKEQAIYLLKRDLRNMAYESVFAMANAIRLKVNHPDMPNKDPECIQARMQLNTICTQCEERKLDPDYDAISLKNSLIAAMNTAFRFLNKVQDHKYPEIKTRKEMIGD